MSNADATPAFGCCGVRIDAHTMESAVEALLTGSSHRSGRTVHLCNAYTLALAQRDQAFQRRLNSSDINLPDGMPLVWIGRRLGLSHLDARVYGPDLMLTTIERGRATEATHYLYGSTPEVVERLNAELEKRFPGVRIVGSESPPFRELTPHELQALQDRLNALTPSIVWVGLGTPKQDYFVDDLRDLVPATFVAIGAAFDFIAGTKRQAPAWLQKRGLEWLYRLAVEPRRLARRYILGNSRFIAGVLSKPRPSLLTGTDRPED